MEEVKDFCKFNKIHVMLIFETKVSTPPSEACVRLSGFNHYDFLPSF